MDKSAKTTCPQEVVRAGAALVRLRRKAEELEALGLKLLPDIKAGIDHVCCYHEAKRMQAGDAIVSLYAALAAPGNVGAAHNVLRLVLGECGISEPTDKQILACIPDDERPEPEPEPDSIR